MPLPGIYPLLGVQTPFDPSNALVTSPVLRSPFALAIWRLLAGTYMIAVLIVTIVWSACKFKDGSAYFSYFTHLSYVGLCAYYWNAGAHGLVFAMRARRKRQDSGGGDGEDQSGTYEPVRYPLQDWPRFLQALHTVLLTTVTTYPIVVTIVFWGLLSSPTTLSTTDLRFNNITMHILNTPLGLFEILFTNVLPLPWATLPFSIFILGLYLCLAYVSHETEGGGYYPYSFLDPNKPGKSRSLLVGYIVGIFLGYCIVFVAMRYLVVLRIWIVRKLMSSEGSDSDDETEEEGQKTSGEEKKGNRREQLGDWEVL